MSTEDVAPVTIGRTSAPRKAGWLAFLRAELAARLAAWPVWWRGLSPLGKARGALIVGAYWLALAGLHGFRGDHVTLGGALLVLMYGGPITEALFKFLLPLLLTGIVYDSQRFYEDYIRGPIHVSEPYRFDKFFFGIHTAQGVLTPNEWWQLHTYPALDLVTGFFYLCFIAIFLLTAANFRFRSANEGTLAGDPALDHPDLRVRAEGMMWAFFWLNVIGYSTYYWYAAAPPWYVASYGLGPANLDVRPNPAGCLRFDQLLGTSFFTGMYGRSADVFGAVPSLHVSYPFQAILYAFWFGRARVFAICFYLIMCFSAVYLNHHYVLDILWGTSYALLITLAVDWRFKRKAAARAA